MIKLIEPPIAGLICCSLLVCQRLLLGYCKGTNLLHYISGHFDTTTGPKNEVPPSLWRKSTARPFQIVSENQSDDSHVFVCCCFRRVCSLLTQSASYKKIASSIGVDPHRIVFFTDNVQEITASAQAGLSTSSCDTGVDSVT